MDFDSEEKRWERQHRRKIIADWKAEARAIQAAEPNKRLLMREANRAALARIEDAARTEDDFENVNRLWDNREIVENWRISKHEKAYGDILPESELSDRSVVIPQPFTHAYWRQLLRGDFLDYIHDCPHEIPEMTTSRSVQDFTRELDENHKEILYYRAIRYWTPQQIAALRGQTDRNIRKVYHTMIDNVRLKLYLRFRPRYIAGLSLTYAQREFCRTFWEHLDDTKKGRLTRKFEEEERKRRKKVKS